MSERRRPRSTVPSKPPSKQIRASTPLPPRGPRPLPPRRAETPRPRVGVARIIDQSETSLVDVIDNLLNRGVVLNADLILALADVDLVYVRLSALLCAADRVLPRR